MPDTIGGYFGLETGGTQASYHEKAIAVNSGRNGLELILRHRPECRRVLLPRYICPAVLIPLQRLGLEWSWYGLTKDLLPHLNRELAKDEILLYANYFGLQDAAINTLADHHGSQLVIDAVQAFFYKPPAGIDTFNSCRKFFGVPDGAYVFCHRNLNLQLERDHSANRCQHLLLRHDRDPESGYQVFQQAEEAFNELPLRRMSGLTSHLLADIDYQNIRRIRRENFTFLHERLAERNQLPVTLDPLAVPLIYPFLREDGDEMKKKLLRQRVFTPTYWPRLHDRTTEGSTEKLLCRHLVCLPIDQRYTIDDMQRIVGIVTENAPAAPIIPPAVNRIP